MAEDYIEKLLTYYPEFFKLSNHVFGHETRPSAKPTVVQPATSQEVELIKQSLENVSEALQNIIGLTKQTVLDSLKVSDGLSLAMESALLLAEISKLNRDLNSIHKAAVPSSPKQDKSETGSLNMAELADKYEAKLDKDLQALDLFLDSSGTSKKPSAQRSVSPPRDYALARAVAVLSYQKPGASPLRNEIKRFPARNDKLPQTKGKEPCLDTHLQNQPSIFQRRFSQRKDMLSIDTFADATDAAKTERAALDAQVLTRPQAHKEGATQEKTLLAPTTEDAQPAEWESRKPELELHIEEYVKKSDKFKYIPHGVLGRLCDSAYDRVIYETALFYKQTLSLAGKVDNILDWSRETLATLSVIQEANFSEYSKHRVDAGDIKIHRTKTSADTLPEASTESSKMDNLIEALKEAQKAGADPSYDVTTARETLALSKGMELDSQFVEILNDLLDEFYKATHPPPTFAEPGTTNGRKKKKITLDELASLEAKAFRKGKSEESKLAVKNPADREVSGLEVDTLVESSNTKGRQESESELLVGGPAMQNGGNQETQVPSADSSESIPSIELEADISQSEVDVLNQAKALFLGSHDGPHRDKFYDVVSFNLKEEYGDLVRSFALNDPRLLEEMIGTLRAFQRLYDYMELIRLQTISPVQLALFHKVIVLPLYFAVLSPVIEELQWNCAVVEHPDNPIITDILKWTAHERSPDGLHHSSGVSVAPVLLHQHPPCPPGLVPNTPAATQDKKKQHKKGRSDMHRRRHKPVEVELPIEESLKSLDREEAVMVAKMKTGVSEPFAKVFDHLMAVADSRRLIKERVRVADAGGKTADRLAERLKKMAVEDGAPEDVLPPHTLPRLDNYRSSLGKSEAGQ